MCAPGLNMLRNSLHLNSADGHEAFVCQYHRTTFDWDVEAKQAERARQVGANASQVKATSRVEEGRAQVLLNAKVLVTDHSILAKVLALPRTLWVGVKFCMTSRDMAKAMQELIPIHVLNGELTLSKDDIK